MIAYDMGENSRGKANLKRWVLSFEQNVETDNELGVSGGSSRVLEQ